jgi:hypothetical protein
MYERIVNTVLRANCALTFNRTAESGSIAAFSHRSHQSRQLLSVWDGFVMHTARPTCGHAGGAEAVYFVAIHLLGLPLLCTAIH